MTGEGVGTGGYIVTRRNDMSTVLQRCRDGNGHHWQENLFSIIA